MTWRTDNFRDPAHKQRALELRNQGITISPHASWGEAAKARRDANREAERNLDSLDQWILATRERIANIKAEADHFVMRMRENMGPCDEIPF